MATEEKQVFKKVWKRVGNQWLRSHVKWLRPGDIFRVEDDDRSFMLTSDIEFQDGIPKMKFIEAR